jgi:hypothetical protein
MRQEFWQCVGFEPDSGGAYVTHETKTSFKGYYRNSTKQDAVLIRSFVQFDGRRDRQRQKACHRRTRGRLTKGSLSSKGSAQSVYKPKRLRSVWESSALLLQVKLVRGLGCNELHGWALHRLGDCLRIAEVVLLSFAIRPHVFSWHQPGIVAE